MLTATDLFWLGLVVMVATAIGVRFRTQITRSLWDVAKTLWALSFAGMVVFLVVRLFMNKDGPVAHAAELYLSSVWGWGAALFTGAWWWRRSSLEKRRGKYVQDLIAAREIRLLKAGITGYPLENVPGVDEEDDWDDEDDGEPDPTYARYTAGMEGAARWAYGSTYALVVIPLFWLTLAA